MVKVCQVGVIGTARPSRPAPGYLWGVQSERDARDEGSQHPEVRIGPGGVIAAIDIGGTKIDTGLVDGSGRVLLRHRAPTDAQDADSLFGLVAGLLERCLQEQSAGGGPPPAVIGVGCGGPMEAGRVSPLNIHQWRDFPLQLSLEERFGLPVRIDNDAKAFALGEGRWGAATGERDYLAMVVSTGVGGGIVLDGRILDGAGGNAGHVGHVIVDPLGRPCPCGARGCLEAQVSGTAVAEITGRPASEAPVELRVHCGRLVGRAVASVCNLLDLRLAVVAGSVALGWGEVFFDSAQEELDRLARLDFSEGSRIVPAGCGADGPLMGAAAVALYCCADGATVEAP